MMRIEARMRSDNVSIDPRSHARYFKLGADQGLAHAQCNSDWSDHSVEMYKADQPLDFVSSSSHHDLYWCCTDRPLFSSVYLSRSALLIPPSLAEITFRGSQNQRNEFD
jgi:hypothetical protein